MMNEVAEVALVSTPTLKDHLVAYAVAIHDDVLLARLHNESDISIATARRILQEKIRGSKETVWRVNAIVAATGFVPISGISPLVNSIPNLDGPLKNLLVGAPSICGSLLMLILGSQLDKNSGKKMINTMRGVSMLGAFGLTLLTAYYEPEEINYSIVLMLNALTGASIPSFLLNNNIISWTPIRDSGAALAKFAATAGIAPSLTLVMLQLGKEYLSLSAAFALSTGVLLAGTLFSHRFVRESPFYQLKQFNVPDENAKALARLFGQEKFPLPQRANYWKSLRETAYDFRALGLSAATIASFGNFLLMTTTLYQTLTHTLQFTTEQAVYTTAGFSFGAMGVRYFVGAPMDRFDKSHGVITFQIGMGLLTVGSIMQGLHRPSPELAYALTAQSLIAMGIGFSSASAFRLLIKWSQPDNATPPYAIGVMGAIASFSGQFAGFGLNAIAAAIVSRDEQGSYFDTFYLMASLALVSSLLVMLTECHIKKPLQQRILTTCFGHFRVRADVPVALADLGAGSDVSSMPSLGRALV